MWGKMTSDEILTKHVVDIHRTEADFRVAFERIQASSSQASGVNKFFSSQSPMQKRFSVYNWNAGPRRSPEDATEKHIAGKWHLITLQEASDYVEHEILHERFHVTHFAGCRLSSTRTPSTLTSASNRSTFTTRSEVCKIILSKENMDGCYKAFCDVLLFVVLQPVVRKSSPFYRYTSTMSLPRKRYCQENHPDRSCSYNLSKH